MAQPKPERPIPPCSHKWVDSKICLRCGRTVADACRELDATEAIEPPPSTPRERPPKGAP
jgi:hypothetical protein